MKRLKNQGLSPEIESSQILIPQELRKCDLISI